MDRFTRIDIDGKVIWEWEYPQSKGLSFVGCILTKSNEFLYMGTRDVLDGSWKTETYIGCIGYDGNEKWNMTLNGPQLYIANSIIESKDGYFLITGWRTSEDRYNNEIYLVKIDKNGKEIWNRAIPRFNSDAGFDIKETEDNGYLIVGNTNYYDDRYTDIYLVKTDSEGKIKWKRAFGIKDQNDWSKSVVITNNGDYIILGQWGDFRASHDSDICLIKLDSNGNKKWCRIYGSEGEDEASSLILTDDGGFAIIGTTEQNGNDDIWFIKTDSEGNVEGLESREDIIGSGVMDKSGVGDNGNDGQSSFPWLWIAIGAGVLIVIIVVVLIIRRRASDDYEDDDEDEDDEDDDEEEEKARTKVPPSPPTSEKKCIKCGAPLAAVDAAFCALCGAGQSIPIPHQAPQFTQPQQLVNCSRCNAVNRTNADFCIMCGNNLKLPPPLVGVPPMGQDLPPSPPVPPGFGGLQ